MVTQYVGFIGAWNEYIYAATFLTKNEQLTLPVGIQRFFSENTTDFPGLMAASFMMSVPVVVLFLVLGSLVGGLIAQLFSTGTIWELNTLGFVLAEDRDWLRLRVTDRLAELADVGGFEYREEHSYREHGEGIDHCGAVPLDATGDRVQGQLGEP